MESRAGHPEYKKFVKSKIPDDGEHNLSHPSPNQSAGGADYSPVSGSDVRKLYEDIVGSESLPQPLPSPLAPRGRSGPTCAASDTEPGAGGAIEKRSKWEHSDPRDCISPQHLQQPVLQSSGSNLPPTLSTLMKLIEWNDSTRVMDAINQDQNLVNAVDQYGWSPLMVAVCAGAIDIVQLLLKSGADASMRDKRGHSCVSLARKKGYLAIVNMIKKFCPPDRVATQSSPVSKEVVSSSKLELCTSCNVSIVESQKTEHLTSTVHQLYRCVKGCRTHYSIRGNNRGYQLMLKNGWDGEKGLGPSGSGVKLPPKTVLKRDRKGLGASKGTARITHFNSHDRKAVARNLPENVIRHQSKSLISKKLKQEKLLEMALRRELS